MRAIFRPEARLELLDAVAWYEGQRLGLGAEFSSDVEAGLRQAIENPGRFRNVTANIRIARLKRFPYFLFFTELPQRIEVLAVLYAGRDPNWIRKRLLE
jgi:toxin ParE1/3/4